MPKQRQPDQANKLYLFFGSLDRGDSDDGKAAVEGISMELREDFLAFFHKQAIKGFMKHCDYILKIITPGNNAARALGVDTPGEDTNDR